MSTKLLLEEKKQKLKKAKKKKNIKAFLIFGGLEHKCKEPHQINTSTVFPDNPDYYQITKSLQISVQQFFQTILITIKLTNLYKYQFNSFLDNPDYYQINKFLQISVQQFLASTK